MTLQLADYVEEVRSQLSQALCLYNVPGVHPEHPEVEVSGTPSFLRDPITIERSPQECCLIESSINSARISLKLKKLDELERWLTRQWTAFLTQAAYAEAVGILRRIPVSGYDVSFVITAQHCVDYSRDSLIDFITHFIKQSVGATTLKMMVSARGRAVATKFLATLAS